MRIKNVDTGQVAVAEKWNPRGMGEIIVLYPDGSKDSDFASNWVCEEHGLPLAADDGRVICEKDLE